jgi:hypothetical protein
VDNRWDMLTKAAAGGLPWRAALRQLAPHLRTPAEDAGFAFDNLAQALAEEVPRREALRRLGGGLAAALLASLGMEAAWGQAGSRCAAFCNNIPPGPQRGQCDRGCAQGGGLFEACQGDSNRLCRMPSGTYVCCATTSSCCNGQCRDLQTDPQNCGTCGRACATGSTCCKGTCCPAEKPNCCSGTCVDLGTDTNNCGACGRVCPTAFTCGSGFCLCHGDSKICHGVCVDTSQDPLNCGDCDIRCPAGTGCCNKECCPADGHHACCLLNLIDFSNGSCVDLLSNPQHCGACGNVCTGICRNGQCTPCPDCQAFCNGACIDICSDPQHCGGCESSCSVNRPNCVNGTCQVCPAGQTECNRTCVDTLKDPQNCGGCSTVCTGGKICNVSLGGCVCPNGLRDCNGTCQDPLTSSTCCGPALNNCTGNPSFTGVCCHGDCCLTGTTCCPANTVSPIPYCTNTDDDIYNCGSCGNICPGGCCQSVCAQAGQKICDCYGPNVRPIPVDSDCCGAWDCPRGQKCGFRFGECVAG